eukprot:m.157581 g.157581  ORF g.157581 m.157581 type:complete len:87 (+) comp13350_c0_seq6:3120-3380(+)
MCCVVLCYVVVLCRVLCVLKSILKVRWCVFSLNQITARIFFNPQLPQTGLPLFVAACCFLFPFSFSSLLLYFGLFFSLFIDLTGVC